MVSTRRRVLSRITLLTGAALLAGTRRPALAQSRAERALACLSDRAAARRVGRDYLAAHPHEADAARLSALIEAALGPDSGPVGTHRALRRAVRADMLAGRSVLVDGWVLAATEARLCALACLL